MDATRLFQALVLAGVAFGCGAKVTVDTGGAGGSGGSTGAGSPPGSVSCDIKTTAAHVCVTYDFTNDTTGLLASAEVSACMAAKGTAGPCPTANALGVCTTKAVAGVAYAETFYSDSSPPAHRRRSADGLRVQRRHVHVSAPFAGPLTPRRRADP